MYFKNIDKNQLKNIIDKKEDILLLDVRTREEFEESNIESSVNIPCEDLVYNIDDIEYDKDKKIVVYCRSGKRSVAACNLLSMAGFSNLYNLTKGIIDYVL